MYGGGVVRLGLPIMDKRGADNNQLLSGIQESAGAPLGLLLLISPNLGLRATFDNILYNSALLSSEFDF